MVVPITKKWESSLARIQVVRRERIVQLVVFLSDFHHGKCMNFVLKGTDTLESFGKGGKFGVRIVDAKFALPKTEDDPASDFVSLDTPEYPMEHDDISIAFDSEAGKLFSGSTGTAEVRLMLMLILMLVSRPDQFPCGCAGVCPRAIEDEFASSVNLGAPYD